LEDIMALESEYVPERTSHLSSLPPDDRRVYKKILWGLIGSYAAVVIIMGVGVVGHIDLQKAADLVVARTWAR
jgi:predicted cobalt transporter CbtA